MKQMSEFNMKTSQEHYFITSDMFNIKNYMNDKKRLGQKYAVFFYVNSLYISER
jgi:hypothetical protein